MKALNVIICLGVFITSSQAVPAWLTHYLPNTFAARTAVVSFSIGTKGYIGCGTKQITTNNPIDQDFRDFWEYNSLNDTWTQKTDFGTLSLGGRKNAVSFVIGSKGYVGTGGNFSGNNLKDFWAYDPSTNLWTAVANFPGSIEYRGVAFAINDIGYVRSGDPVAMAAGTAFWSFDGTSWTQKTDITPGPTGLVRTSAAGFSLNGKGYIGTGYNSGPKKDFYEYNPTLNSWTQKADFGGVSRFNSFGCSTASKGYIGLGYDAVGEARSVWEYDPAGAGTWTRILDYPGGDYRAQAFGFTIADNLYVGTGNTGSGSESNYFNDFYIYAPSGVHVLPVELTTINANADAQKEQVAVNWQTATEKESAYFAIERQSKTNGQFEEIGRVKGAGNSDKTLTYNFIDEKPVYGVSYYRLRLADIDGKTTYSKTVSVSYKGGAKVKVFPTYTDGYVTIENGDKHIDGIYVWNASGQLMLQSKQTHLYLCDLPRGMYLVQVKEGSETFVQKITKW